LSCEGSRRGSKSCRIGRSRFAKKSAFGACQPTAKPMIAKIFLLPKKPTQSPRNAFSGRFDTSDDFDATSIADRAS
jgi:hypothetical protein